MPKHERKKEKILINTKTIRNKIYKKKVEKRFTEDEKPYHLYIIVDPLHAFNDHKTKSSSMATYGIKLTVSMQC